MANYCAHVYQNMGAEICPLCGKHTHEINWRVQNQMRLDWKAANPNAKSDGWWSI